MGRTTIVDRMGHGESRDGRRGARKPAAGVSRSAVAGNGGDGLAAVDSRLTSERVANGRAREFAPRLERAASRPTAVALIASGAQEVRKRWRRVIAGTFVMREATERRSLERDLASERPSILLLDLQLPELDGIRDLARIRQLHPSTRIVVLTSRTDLREGVAVVKAGAWGYAERDIESPLLVKVLEVVERGETWLGRPFVSALLEELWASSERSEPGPRGRSHVGPR